jgi:plastocyanin
MPFSSRALRSAAIVSLILITSMVGAAPLSVQVVDSAGQPVADAAVYAEPASGQAPQKSVNKAQIEQRGHRFLPQVTVVQTGTDISFPNNDTVRHHVYSFSPAKTFELKLYSGVPVNPVNFDKPGTIVVGCNIHDDMVAYIHVVPTPYFGKTGASGKIRLEGLMPGKYHVKAWHSALPAGTKIPEQDISIAANETAAFFKLNIKSAPATN